MKIKYAFYRYLFVAMVLIFLLSGCTSTAHKVFNEKSYTLGAPISVVSGQAIADELDGEVDSKRNWVGIMNSKDGWSGAWLTFSKDFLEKKLYFLGFDPPNLYLMMRRFEQGSDKPSYEDIQAFNLEASGFVRMGDYHLEVDVEENPPGKYRGTFRILDPASWKSAQQDFQLKVQHEQEQPELQSLTSAVE